MNAAACAGYGAAAHCAGRNGDAAIAGGLPGSWRWPICSSSRYQTKAKPGRVADRDSLSETSPRGRVAHSSNWAGAMRWRSPG